MIRTAFFVLAFAAWGCSSADENPTKPSGPAPHASAEAGSPDAGPPKPEAGARGNPDGAVEEGSVPSDASLDATPAGALLTGFSNVYGFADKAGTASVGATGGTVTATVADTTYTLTIPAGALADPVDITLVPTTAVTGVTGIAGGWQASPEGLTFLAAATLTVHLGGNQTPPPLAFAYSGDGADLHEYPVETQGSDVTFPILHFSGGGVGSAIAPGAPSAEGLAMQAIARELKKSSPSADAIVQALTNWYKNAVKPGLVVAATDPDPLKYIDWYTSWKTVCVGFPYKLSLISTIRAAMQTLIAEADDLAATAFKSQVDLENADCARLQDFEVGKRALILQGRADLLGLADAQHGLDLDTVLSNLCIQVHVETIDFPQSVNAGDSGSLTLKVGYTLGGQTPHFDHPVRVKLTATGTTSDGDMTKDLDANGEGTLGPFTRAGSAQLELAGNACLVDALEICQVLSVVRGNSGGDFATYSAKTWGALNPTGTGEDFYASFRDLGGKILFNLVRDPHNGFTYSFAAVTLDHATAASFGGDTVGGRGNPYLEDEVQGFFSEEADGPHLHFTLTSWNLTDPKPDGALKPPPAYVYTMDATEKPIP